MLWELDAALIRARDRLVVLEPQKHWQEIRPVLLQCGINAPEEVSNDVRAMSFGSDGECRFHAQLPNKAALSERAARDSWLMRVWRSNRISR
jgi:hypothetical protein